MTGASPRLVRWFVLGGLMAALGFVIGATALWWTLQGFFSVDAELPTDGAEHELALDADTRYLVWAYDAVSAPDCRVSGADGARIPLEPVDRDLRRSDGTAGDWVGVARFTSDSGPVVATCEAGGGRGNVLQLTPALSVDALLGHLLVRSAVPILLLVAGLVLLAVTALRWVRAQSRSETT